MVSDRLLTFLPRGLQHFFTSPAHSKKPKTLNLLINDICNSRCRMCNIWKKKREKELSPDELRLILSDSLFDELEYVGVSGGEPTLRHDLDEMFEAIVSSLKTLKGTGLITNAVARDHVLHSIEKIDMICRKARVPFNVMVSLDGIGAAHDAVRGRDGNFETAAYVLRHLRDRTDIPISIGCTIIKENVWNVDEVLQFCRDEGICGRFRIGEFINRLYNQDLKEQIRNFDEDERYQIVLFFSKLYYGYETLPAIKATYKSIMGMIGENRNRSSGCPYRHSALSMDCAGNILYCSPKSPKIGSCLEKSAYRIYCRNIKVREQIVREHCPACIHDYHDDPPASYLQDEAVRGEWMTRLSVTNSLTLARMVELPAAIDEKQKFTKVLIIGWYGTETAGDKAILDEILHRLLNRSPEVKITVASLFSFVTIRTLKELGREQISVIDTYSSAYLAECKQSEVVIMGGGPLMGMEPLGLVLTAFAEAAKAGVPTIIEGCGIGPISEPTHIETLKEIVRLASSIRVRDTKSLEWIQQHSHRHDAIYSGDPSIGFISRFNRKGVHSKKNTLACLLREITTEYTGDLSINEFEAFRNKFEDELGKIVQHICATKDLIPLFIPMHTFVIGNDDRDFARRFAKKNLKEYDYELCEKIYTPYDILTKMQEASFCLCMRFHSVVFAEMIEQPYIAIDYTGGGKILGFLKDRNKLSRYIDRQNVANGGWLHFINNILVS